VTATRSRLALSICLGAALVAPAARAADTAPKRKAPRAAAGLSVEEVALMLSSSSPDEVRLALETAPSLKNRQVTPLFIERVRAGLKPELVLVAVDGLAALGDARCTELLGQLARHRRVEVRARALLALAALKAEASEQALVRGLSDSAEEVRDAAADGLALMGAKRSLPVLFQAFDRGVGKAGSAIGQLVEPASLPRVTSYFGRVSFVSLAPMLDALFTRRNLSDDVKVGLVQSIAKHHNADARGYLEGLGDRLPSDASATLRRIITETWPRMPK
jgi:HEAT repeat protein